MSFWATAALPDGNQRTAIVVIRMEKGTVGGWGEFPPSRFGRVQDGQKSGEAWRAAGHRWDWRFGHHGAGWQGLGGEYG